MGAGGDNQGGHKTRAGNEIKQQHPVQPKLSTVPEPGQHCVAPARAKDGASGKKRRKRLGLDATQAEADTDGAGGEERELEFPISAVLYES